MILSPSLDGAGRSRPASPAWTWSHADDPAKLPHGPAPAAMAALPITVRRLSGPWMVMPAASAVAHGNLNNDLDNRTDHGGQIRPHFVHKFRSNSDLCLTGDLRQMLPGVIAYGILFDLNLYHAQLPPDLDPILV